MVKVKSISVDYGSVRQLKDCSAQFAPGQFHCILGANGCGKTTLLKAIAGLLPCATGQVLLDGTPIHCMTRRELAKKISFLPQNKDTVHLTAQVLVEHGRYAYLEFPRKLRPEDREAVQWAMERAGVSGLRGRSIATLSGGERQRVYLAMLLAQSTQYLLLDEPTTYLDPGHQLQTLELARQLTKEGKTVLAVLHDLPLALCYADQIYLMEQGGLIWQGPVEQEDLPDALERLFGVGIHRLVDDAGVHWAISAQ